MSRRALDALAPHDGVVCTIVAPSRVDLPISLGSGRVARRFTEDRWCPTHCGTDLGRVHLLVTELVVNAVEHGGPPILLELECTGTEVIVRVSDGGSAIPEPQHSPPEAEGGRGVQLVDLLSPRWGIEHYRRDPIDLRTAPSDYTSDEGSFADCDGVAETVWCRLVPA